MVGEVNVLLVSVLLAVVVSIVPDVGNVAVELTPVPPLVVGSSPLTEPLVPRGRAPQVGAELVVATSVWPVVPAAVAPGVKPAPPPYTTPYCGSAAEDVRVPDAV
jgi:hypothetical protein